MHVIRDFFGGILSVVKVLGAPLLYRYPYRTSAEGLRSDWIRIGQDIEAVIGALKTDAEHGRAAKK